MPEKIAIQPITLRDQKPTDIKESWLELNDNHISYHIEFYADEYKDENDESLGIENIYNKFDITVLKSFVAGVEKNFTLDKKWGVFIRIMGFTNDLKVYFRSEQKAQELYDKLYSWLTNNS